jgi:hypothetical protein
MMQRTVSSFILESHRLSSIPSSDRAGLFWMAGQGLPHLFPIEISKDIASSLYMWSKGARPQFPEYMINLCRPGADEVGEQVLKTYYA